MTRIEYVERVLSVMRHVTPSEREAIRAEIDAHIEDHICDLLELDYDEALAEERTMARMGDPEEVGRELDKQYTNAFWLWLEGIAKILLVPMILVSLLGIGILFHAVDHLEARFAPAQGSTEDFTAEAMPRRDIVRIFLRRLQRKQICAFRLEMTFCGSIRWHWGNNPTIITIWKRVKFCPRCRCLSAPMTGFPSASSPMTCLSI